MSAPQTETLRGTLRGIRFSGRGYWSIASLELTDRSCTTIVGPLNAAEPGDSLELDGEWVTDKKYGKQFKHRACRILTPADAEGIVAWMAGRLPDVGRARAIEIVRAIGVEQIWHVLEHEPQRLCVVPGITPERARAIQQACQRQRAHRDTLVWLQRWGLTEGQCGRILQRYGAESEAVLRRNPYRLTEIDGFGFVTVDGIAQKLGVALDHIERACAAVLYQLDVARQVGHVYVPTSSLVKRCLVDLEIPAARTREAVAALAADRKVILEGEDVYLPALHEAERIVAARLAALTKKEDVA